MAFADDYKNAYNECMRGIGKSSSGLMWLSPGLFEAYGGDLDNLQCDACDEPWNDCPCDIVTLVGGN